jgi:hypothetical protein
MWAIKLAITLTAAGVELINLLLRTEKFSQFVESQKR